MQKSKIFTTRMIVTVGLLTAVSMVLTRLLMIEPTQNIRISFGHLPIVLCGLMFGPVAGAVTGFIADFLGVTFMSPYAWFAPLGITPVLMGLIPGLMRYVFLKHRTPARLVLCMLPAYILGPLFWSSYSLHLLYGTSYEVLLTTRLPVSACIAVVEIVMTVLFVRSGAPRAAGMPELSFNNTNSKKITG